MASCGPGRDRAVRCPLRVSLVSLVGLQNLPLCSSLLNPDASVFDERPAFRWEAVFVDG